MESNDKKPSGLLNVATGKEHFTLDLHLPSLNLAQHIEHYWIINWDLRGQEPYISENLPHPSVHLVIEKDFFQDQSRVVGIVTEKFSIKLEEKGFVFGIKFRPGAAFPFVKIPTYEYTGLSIPAQELFGSEINLFKQAILSSQYNQVEMVKLAEVFLYSRMPEQDETLLLINRMVERIKTDSKITTVADISNIFHITVRSLQRIFKTYVGVSPKWVIKRYRLLEIADLLAKGQPQSWHQIVSELGYYDQSHLIKDFKNIVGHSPEQYIKKNKKLL